MLYVSIHDTLFRCEKGKQTCNSMLIISAGRRGLCKTRLRPIWWWWWCSSGWWRSGCIWWCHCCRGGSQGGGEGRREGGVRRGHGLRSVRLSGDSGAEGLRSGGCMYEHDPPHLRRSALVSSAWWTRRDGSNQMFTGLLLSCSAQPSNV